MTKHSSLLTASAIAVFCLAAPALGQWPEIDKLLAADGAAADWFGNSVSISGDTVVVGALYDEGNCGWSGSAYVFQKSGWDWVQVAELLPSDGALNDWFGCSVSISGDTVVVGAHGDDDNGTDFGSAYVFERPNDGWSGTLNEDAKLLPGDGAAGDYFGISVSISGETVVVGALWDDDNGIQSGSAYVFEKSGSNWGQVAKLLASDGAADAYFGCSVSISGDTVVLGASGNGDDALDSGSAYVFEMPAGGWSGMLNEDARLLPSDGAAGDWFGCSVSISGETVVVGAIWDDYNGYRSGSAHVFARPVGGWSGTLNQNARLLVYDGAAHDYFGGSVSISGDTVVIGASGDDDHDPDSGSAYVFQDSGSGWMRITKLRASDGARNDSFGVSVSISGDTIVVGAYEDDDNATDSGAAYVFQDSGSGWVQVAKLLASDGAARERFGISVSISGDTVVVGAYHDDDNGASSGSAYVFERPVDGWSGTLNQDAKLLAGDGAVHDYFGWSVSIAGDTVVVGARSDRDNGTATGSACVFERPGGGWSGTLIEDAKLLPSDGAAWDGFGQSASISGDTIVVGAYGDDDNGSNSGSAYVFERPGGGWSGTLNEDARLLPSDGAAGDRFGRSVSISGDTVVVGTIGDDDNGSSSGSAYVFERPGGGWSGTLNQDAKLLASDGAGDDRFGCSVSISGETVVAGAIGDDDSGRDSGSAYVFTRLPLGDLNCDGVVDPLDIDPFVAALTSAGNPDPFDDYYAVWPDCNPMLADINGDGTVNLFDIDPFVELLTV